MSSLSKLRLRAVTIRFKWSSMRSKQKRVEESILVLFRHNRMYVTNDFRPQVPNSSGINNQPFVTIVIITIDVAVIFVI